jgi:G:T-mismatch repair DNA endonuclease (very short patch repair protein)
LMAHAAGCPHCAARMRRGLNLLSENASLEEDAAVAALLSTPGTRWRSLAAQLAATPHHGTHGRRARIYLRRCCWSAGSPFGSMQPTARSG